MVKIRIANANYSLTILKISLLLASILLNSNLYFWSLANSLDLYFLIKLKLFKPGMCWPQTDMCLIFLEIVFVHDVYICTCVYALVFVHQLSKFYGFSVCLYDMCCQYSGWGGLNNNAYHECLPNKIRVEYLSICFIIMYIRSKTE